MLKRFTVYIKKKQSLIIIIGIHFNISKIYWNYLLLHDHFWLYLLFWTTTNVFFK